MAVGWSKDGAVQDEIDSAVEEALDRARRSAPAGESRESCATCGRAIPEARRKAIAGVKLCIACQSAQDDE